MNHVNDLRARAQEDLADYVREDEKVFGRELLFGFTATEGY